MLIHELTTSKISLLPFTIDPHGGLGPFATSFLFRATPTPKLPHLCPTAHAAHTLASGPSTLCSLLPRANASWTTNNYKRLFGKTYRTPTPGAWARQLLGINFLHGAFQHFSQATAKQLAPLHPSPTPPTHILGQNSTYYFTRTSISPPTLGLLPPP
jgi:hypothetical protein